MSYKKIYIFSLLIGLVIGLIIIVVVKNYSTLNDKQRTSVIRPGWVEVAPPTRLFKAYFPVSPERVKVELPIPGTDDSLIQESHIATDVKGNVYRIVTFIYPRPFSTEQTDEVLDAALQGMATIVPGNTILENTIAVFDELPAKMFMIQDKDGRYHHGELFLKGRVLYQVFVTYDGGDLVEEDLQYFLDSITPTVDAEPVL